MAHQRMRSTAGMPAGSGANHGISLKVLRLSRPSLATQTPLPATHFGYNLDIPRKASLAFPCGVGSTPTTKNDDDDDNDNERDGDKNQDAFDAAATFGSSFPLTPLLTLPPAFGAAYVGEKFEATLCANCEVEDDDDKTSETRRISGVRIEAELQTPGNQAGIALELSQHSDAEDDADELRPGSTLQRTLAYELKEEGPHQLAVTVTYTETLVRRESGDDGGTTAAGGRARTFRKLYQFVARPLIAVRSKVSERKVRRSLEEQEGQKSREWVLEAQLENVGETAAVVERVWVGEREGLVGVPVDSAGEAVVLKPQDVEQVMFVLRGVLSSEDGGSRVQLAQLHVEWRSGGLGERGRLTTGWLSSRGR